LKPALATILLSLLVWLPGGLLEGAEGAGDKALKAYRAARILRTALEPAAPGAILVRGATVEAVLPAAEEPPPGAELIDLGDVVVLPGLVNPLSALSERSYRRERSGRASQSPGSPDDARRAVALSKVDPRESLYRRLGRSGYAAIALVPGDGGGLIAGRASVIRPRRGGEKEASELAVAESAYLLLNFATGKTWRDAAERHFRAAAEKIVKEEEAKKKAAAEAEAQKKAAEEKKPEPKKEEPKQEAVPAAPRAPEPPDPLVLAFKGEVPVLLRVQTPAAIDHLLKLLDGLPIKLRFVLVTRPQPPEVVEKLAARRGQILAVVLEPRLAELWETSILVPSARHLLERGVEVAFVPLEDSLDGHREVFFHLAEMVRSGLRPEQALSAVTATPAKLLGLGGKVGSLERGAAASFAVYDRDPLCGSARLLQVYVGGERVFCDDPQSGRLSGEAVR
jgi:hypothetical protein